MEEEEIEVRLRGNVQGFVEALTKLIGKSLLNQ